MTEEPATIPVQFPDGIRECEYYINVTGDWSGMSARTPTPILPSGYVAHQDVEGKWFAFKEQE